MLQLPQINQQRILQYLVEFIQNQLQQKGFKKVVLGLSGGLDSSLVAYLAVQALGSKHVHCFYLPYKSIAISTRRQVESLVKQFGLQVKTIDITPQLDMYFKEQHIADRIRRGNKMARERMSILFDQAKKLKALVIGTSNKTEILLGYGTWFGDTAWSFNPIGDLYKTYVRSVAEYCNIPSDILNQPPSADLWLGQTDEEELGYTYEQIDLFLYYYLDLGATKKELQTLGFGKKLIEDLMKRIHNNAFKSQLSPIALFKGKFY